MTAWEDLPATVNTTADLSVDLMARICDVIEDAGVEAIAATGLDVRDSILRGVVVLGIWDGGLIPAGLYALSFLASPEVNVAALAPKLRELADLWDLSEGMISGE